MRLTLEQSLLAEYFDVNTKKYCDPGTHLTKGECCRSLFEDVYRKGKGIE